MSELSQLILKQIESGNFALALLLVLALAVIASVRNASAILDFFHRIQSREQDILVAYLKQEHLSESVRARIADEFNGMIYTKRTGIRGDFPFIERVAAIIAKSQGEIPTNQVRRAQGFLKVRAGKVVVRVTRADKLMRAFLLLVGWFILAASVAIVAIVVIVRPGLVPGALMLLVAIATYFCSLLTFQEAQPMRIAQELQPLIERFQQDQAALPATPTETSGALALPVAPVREESEGQVEDSTRRP